jgi:simple sugar transport system permease protein
VIDFLVAVFSFAFLAQVLSSAVPITLAALGGAVTERSGVIDLALEAKLLFGAFGGAALAHATGAAEVGVLGGIAAGTAVAALQLWLTLRLGADQVIVGVGLNLLALGGTRYMLQLFYDEGSNSPPTDAFGSLLANPVFWIAVLASIAVPFALVRTRWGLRLRAAGDRPDALVAVGASPVRARFLAGLVGGARAGAGGAPRSLAIGGFVAKMSAGRGYIALAMVILAAWRPSVAVVACLLVSLAAALAVQLQLAGVPIPSELAPELPMAITLVVLVIAGRKSLAPRSLGKL